MAEDVQVISGTKAAVAARLSNFRTGSKTPLGSHTAWLTANVKPIIASNPNAWVDLIGHASRKWNNTQGMNSHDLNRQLSYARCEAVKAQVKSYSAQANFNIELADGDKDSLMPDPNDGYDRAVEIYVYASGKRPDPPPPPPQPDSGTYEIRVVGGGSASVLAQTDDYFFQIVDRTRGTTAFYFYTGLGIGISIPKIPGPGSVTKAGPPTTFHTKPKHAELYMFNSQASLFQDPGATLGPFSVGGTMYLALDEVADFEGMIFTVPKLIPISGGSGIQMPGLGSASKGVFAKVTDDWPFTGY